MKHHDDRQLDEEEVSKIKNPTFSFLSVSKIEKFWNCWRTTEQWIDIIVNIFPESKVFAFSKNELNRVIAIDPVLKHCLIQCGSICNQHGNYFDSHKKNGQQTTAIYCCAPNTTVRKPPSDTKWWTKIATRTPLLRRAHISIRGGATFGTLEHDNKRQRIEATGQEKCNELPPSKQHQQHRSCCPNKKKKSFR